MTKYKDIDGNEIILGDYIGFGGEADVYEVANSTLVAKIYNSDHTIDAEKLEKLELMSELFDDKKIAKYYAWPQKVIYSRKKPVGILMENINSSANTKGSKYIKFCKFYNMQDRRTEFPLAEYKFLVRAASNLATAIQTLHEKGIVIGDINESNVFVNNTDATIKLIDCDSYQFKDFMCDVGKPEYSAPELPNKLRGERRTVNHDYFAMAVMIFLILVGKHPYTGVDSDLSNLRNSIVNGLYCYGKDADAKGVYALSPYVEIFEMLNDEIKDLFEQAFNTTDRPTTQQWIDALKRYEDQLVECDKSDKHWYNSDYDSCLWCYLEQEGMCFAFGDKPKVKKIKHNYKIAQVPYTPTVTQKQVQQPTSYNSNYQPQTQYTSNYSNSQSNPFMYKSTFEDSIWHYIVGIIAVVVIAIMISSHGGNSSTPNTRNIQSQTSSTATRGSYPSCDADSTLKPMKRERTAKLKPLLEDTDYVLNANYSLWYRNIKSTGNGYCSAEEMIKNMFWADPNVYLVHPITYKAYYQGGNTTTESSSFYDLGTLVNDSDFYSGNRKLSDDEVNNLLDKSLP